MESEKKTRKPLIIKHISIRIPNDLLVKFKSVCEYEGRSINRQILTYIRNAIKEFDKPT